LVDRTKKAGEAGPDEVELVIGGQAAPFPIHQVVDFDTALQAADYWAQHAKPDPSLSWEQH
jgi:hypothetical protein